MGYKNSELLYDLMSKPMTKYASKEIVGMSSRNHSKNKKSLKNVFTFFSKKNGDIIKKLTKGFGIEYGNKIGQPLISGSVLTFEHVEKDQRLGYDKVIMMAGGIGYGRKDQAQKKIPSKGDIIVILGGDNYRIGNFKIFVIK